MKYKMEGRLVTNIENGEMICKTHIGERAEWYAERITTLLDASDGMTTKQAIDALGKFKDMLDATEFLTHYMPVVKYLNTSDLSIEEAEMYLRYGPEMRQLLLSISNGSLDGEFREYEFLQMYDLLSKLNREG